MNELVLLLADERWTKILGEVLAPRLLPGDVVLLTGDLGAGKTTLVKGLMGALDESIDVTSPSFALCHQYDSIPPIAHVDCWRMESESELDELALDELLDDGWVAVIEWGERLGSRYDDRALHITLTTERDGRAALLVTNCDRWMRELELLAASSGSIGGSC